jgi:hypothetical protein
MRLNEELIKRDSELTELIQKVDESLTTVPAGSLRVAANYKQPKYYIRSKPSERSGKYVRQADLRKAAALAQRDYDMELRAAAGIEQMAVRNLMDIREHTLPEDVFGKLILPRRQLVEPRFISDEEFAAAWLAEPYTPKPFEEGAPEYHSTSGTRVRSKSEIILADIFDSYPIPRKFECPVKLYNGKIIHPDFTLLNVRERKEFIWEHFGRADDPGYMRYNVTRLNALIRSGFIPGVNMIMTFETGETPLDTNTVKALIEAFLL